MFFYLYFSRRLLYTIIMKINRNKVSPIEQIKKTKLHDRPRWLFLIIVGLVGGILWLTLPSYFLKMEFLHHGMGDEIENVNVYFGQDKIYYNSYLRPHVVHLCDEEEYKEHIASLDESIQSNMQGALGMYMNDTGEIFIAAEKMESRYVRWDDWNSPEEFEFTCTFLGDYNVSTVLKHEYGHAFLNDYLIQSLGSTEYINESFGTLIMDNELCRYHQGDRFLQRYLYPRELQELFKDFENVSEWEYGDSHYTSNFHEYFAESYARFLEKKEIPERTMFFFMKTFNHKLEFYGNYDE